MGKIEESCLNRVKKILSIKRNILFRYNRRRKEKSNSTD